MALEDYLGTPAGYATPDQLASVKQYADLLMKGGQRDDTITSPWQGVRMMADTLSGNVMRNRMGQQQMAGIQDYSHRLEQAPGGQNPLGSQASAAPQGGMDPYDARVAKLESGGNPNSVTGHQYGLMQMGTPELQKYGITNWADPNQQISGLHQERAANVQALTKALGRPPTPGEEYLAHQQGLAGATAELTHPNMPAWQAVRPYYKTDAMAQKAIAGNPPGGGKVDPNEPAGKFANDWVTQFNSRMPSGMQTTSLTQGTGGASGAPPIGSPQAMSGALAANTGGHAPATTGPLPTTAMPQSPGQLQPGMVPTRPQISRRDYEAIMANPWAPQSLKDEVRQNYMMQNQPQQFQSDYGTTLISPQGGQQFIGKPITNTYESPGGGKAPVQYRYKSDGSLEETPVGGGSAPMAPPQTPPPIFDKLTPKQPPVAGPVGPQGSIAPPGAGQTAAAQASPMGLLAGAGGGQGAPAPAGAKTAMATPGNVGSDAPPIGGMFGTPPPKMASPPFQTPAGPQVAQNSVLPGRAGQIMNELQQRGVDYAGQSEQAKEMAKSGETERTAINDTAKKSGSQMSQLQTAQKLVDDPNFVSGLVNTPGTILEKARALMGSNPNAARAIETFDKIMAGATLPEVTSQTKGVGQVRLAEFETVKSSLASRNLTPPGIKAVLGIMLAAHQQNLDVSELASGFSQGWRIGPDGKPYNSGKQGLNDPEWQPTLNKFLAANPVITPEARANWEKEFGSNLAQETARTLAGMQGRENETGSGAPAAGKPQRSSHPQPQGAIKALRPGEVPPPLPPGNWQEHL